MAVHDGAGACSHATRRPSSAAPDATSEARKRATGRSTGRTAQEGEQVDGREADQRRDPGRPLGPALGQESSGTGWAASSATSGQATVLRVTRPRPRPTTASTAHDSAVHSRSGTSSAPARPERVRGTEVDGEQRRPGRGERLLGGPQSPPGRPRRGAAQRGGDRQQDGGLAGHAEAVPRDGDEGHRPGDQQQRSETEQHLLGAEPSRGGPASQATGSGGRGSPAGPGHGAGGTGGGWTGGEGREPGGREATPAARRGRPRGRAREPPSAGSPAAGRGRGRARRSWRRCGPPPGRPRPPRAARRWGTAPGRPRRPAGRRRGTAGRGGRVMPRIVAGTDPVGGRLTRLWTAGCSGCHRHGGRADRPQSAYPGISDHDDRPRAACRRPHPHQRRGPARAARRPDRPGRAQRRRQDDHADDAGR